MEPCTWTIPIMPDPNVLKRICEVFDGRVERFQGNLVKHVPPSVLEDWAAKKWVEKRVYGTRIHWMKWVNLK